MRKALLGAVTVAALIGIAACNRGEAPTPSNGASDSASSGSTGIIRERQSHYKDMGKASKAIADELRADTPSLPTVRENAQRLADYAPRILTWFPAGSGPEAGVRTRAKAEIWSDQEGFGRAAAGFITAAEQFNAIVKSGDVAAIRADRVELGKACSNCHDRFRAPERE
ncbi:cytochrome c [Sphingosinicella sp. LHD-64]|uniref:c-type cytochrome n=1 Tax=Sphingosinicella sp. LHD-64 TaxID=3072139 RepID=UPI00280F59DA|nr:cytochrome c [Sphingosinicella sp. LHD-64]MDQ8754724.1 cytochrome c [Sphingosinicella sp. LHD-64]